MAKRLYDLWVTVNEVHDGDTLYGHIDLGVGTWHFGMSQAGIGLRLDGCNARELAMPGGKEARDNLASLIPVGSVIKVQSSEWDKYSNRIIVSIVLVDGTDLVRKLVAEQWAASWNGVGEKPVPPWPRHP
jgi:endonuclease YncB( thermonuclease family)